VGDTDDVVMRNAVRRLAGALTVSVLLGCPAACSGADTAGGTGSASATARPVPPPGRSLAVPGSGWASAMSDARHSSATTAVGPQTATLRWRRRLEGDATPGPAVGRDGTVYLSSNAGILHAVDPLTGRDRWSFSGGGGYGSDLSTTPAVLTDDTVLWPGPRHTLYALDHAGHRLWSETFAATVLSPAVAAGGVVYVADTSGSLTRVDVGPGGAHHRGWTIPLGDGGSYASPAVTPDGLVIGAVGPQVVAVRDDTAHGVLAWRFPVGELIEVSPAVTPDGTVVIGANDPFEYGISSAGQLLWRYRKDSWSYSSPVATPDGRVWFGDHRGVLNVLDGATGAPLARHQPVTGPVDGSLGVWTAPAVDARGDVYWGTVSGHIYGYGPGGNQLFDLPTGAVVDSYPALGPDGTLYLGSADGTVYAIHS
jgi:outer membrane protein assembly factor BamB